jgi:hypothetical protein
MSSRPQRQHRRRIADPCAGKPHNWPFGALTEAQIRARIRFESALRAGRLAPADWSRP